MHYFEVSNGLVLKWPVCLYIVPASPSTVSQKSACLLEALVLVRKVMVFIVHTTFAIVADRNDTVIEK